MMDFLLSIYNNKLLFYGIIVVAGFIIFSIFLVKRIDKEKTEDELIDYEKIDGDNSLFDEAINHDSGISTSDGKLDLEVMIEKMQKDLDAKASEVVEKFEAEQEEKSVISYQELVGEKAPKLDSITSIDSDLADTIVENVDNEENNYVIEDDINNNIQDIKINNSILETKVNNDIIEDYSSYKEDYRKEKLQNILDIDEANDFDIHDNIVTEEALDLHQKDEFVNALKTGEYENEPKGKFKSTDFVSPIYGVQDINIKYPTVQNMKEFKQPARNYNKFELEQTLNMQPLSDEIRQNEAFLEALKEFRKNLE